MIPVLLLLVSILAPSGGLAAADEDRDYLEACLAAAGGYTAGARTTCFGQVSKLCLTSSAGTTADMESCAARELAVWEAYLQDAYAELEASQPSPRMAAIRTAQEAWRPWRTARCDVYATFDGTIFGALAGLCRAETTSRRVVDLWEIQTGFVGER